MGRNSRDGHGHVGSGRGECQGNAWRVLAGMSAGMSWRCIFSREG